MKSKIEKRINELQIELDSMNVNWVEFARIESIRRLTASEAIDVRELKTRINKFNFGIRLLKDLLD